MATPVSLNNGTQAVPAQQIIDTGRVDVFTDERAYANQTFNVQGQDSFATAVRMVGEQSAAAIAAEAEQVGSPMHALFQKAEWSGADRAIYEERLANEVSERMDNVPGLHEYRVSQGDATYMQDLGIDYQGDLADQRAGHLNDLGSDVNAYSMRANAEGGTQRMNAEGGVQNGYAVEYDCESMAIAEGVALQIAENKLEETGHFDAANAGTNNFKQSMDYYVVNGAVKMDGASQAGGHQFIMTPLGNIVEATVDPSNSGSVYGNDTYLRTNGNLQSFAQGEPLVAVGSGTGRRDVYGPRADDSAVSTRFNQTYANAGNVVIMNKELVGGREAPPPAPTSDLDEPVEAPAIVDNAAPPPHGVDDSAEMGAEEWALLQLQNGAVDLPVTSDPAPVSDAHVPVRPEYSLQDPDDKPAMQGQGNQVLDFDPATLETQQMLAQLGFELNGANNGMDGLEGPSTRGAIHEYAQANQLDVENMTTAELQDHMVQQIAEQQSVLNEVLQNPGGEGVPVETADGASPAKISDDGILSVNGRAPANHFQAAASDVAPERTPSVAPTPAPTQAPVFA